MQAVVIEAREVRQKARRIRQKCDSRDAFEMCDGLRRDIYTSLVYVPGPEVQGLRRILSRRRHFVKLCTSQVNAAKFLLRSLGLAREAKSLTTQEAWEKLLQRGAVEPVREYVAMHVDVWRVAQEKVVLLEKELKESLKPFKSVADRLQKVPGVGTITAATYIAVLATPDRFVESGRVISYIGLISSGYDTDDSVRRGHIANHAFRVRSCGSRRRRDASALIMQRRALTPSPPTGCGF